MITFRPIELADKETLLRYLRLYPDNEGSECTFSNLYIWGQTDGIGWAIEDDCLLLHGRRQDGMPCMMMAFAPRARMCCALGAGITAMAERKEAFCMSSLPAWYCDLMADCRPGFFVFEREPHHDDYVYNTADLLNLPGRDFHAKRNHINKFTSMYEGRYDYLPYTPDLAEACMAVYDRWAATQGDAATFAGERLSVHRALRHAQALGLVGGVLRVAGRVEAFSVGERITGDMALIHIEKANADIPGLFTMINREFVRNAFADTRWINREEDMGLEGLRRAKRSYNPARMIEKYSAVLAHGAL
ncbi:MAG: phosphatidylglycerol lysyltransferase domain-containing protein [Oscillospiraceae bacterium]|jgi:hypothetical protein|nr:phosphatidylglycerol lysyltransferase domain-containing protein [Oscillospiraceae bacterium]